MISLDSSVLPQSIVRREIDSDPVARIFATRTEQSNEETISWSFRSSSYSSIG